MARDLPVEGPLVVKAPPLKWWRLLGIVCLVVAVVCFGVPFLPAYQQRVLDSVMLYMLLAMGLNMVVGYAGLLDLGFIAFYAIGAYTYAILASAQFDLHLPFLLVMLIAVALAGLAGVLLGMPVLKLRGDYLAIVTLGFGEVIRILINNLDGLTNGPQGITRIDDPVILGYVLRTPLDFFFLLFFMVLVVFLFTVQLERSLIGTAWRALREDQDAAAGLGLPVPRLKLLAFGTSAAIGGAAGVVFAAQQRFVDPESFSFWESLVVLLIIVVGGVGNLLGVVLGALVMVVLPEFLRDYADLRMLIYGICLLIIIIARPNGLLPRQYDIGWLLRIARIR